MSEEQKIAMRIAGHKTEGGLLYITIEGDGIDQLKGPEAKWMAYNARFDYGFGNSGIEKYEGPIPVTVQEEGAPPRTRYQITFRLTPAF
jgi:hypothetical protein